MKKLLLALTLTLSLGACTQLQSFKDEVVHAYDVVAGVVISPTTVYVARNAYDVVERSAANYLVFCHKNPSNLACSKTVEGKLVDAVRAGRDARRNVTAYMKAHPDGAGAGDVYGKLTLATSTIKQILEDYNIKIGQ
jgi:hypothetical protein